MRNNAQNHLLGGIGSPKGMDICHGSLASLIDVPHFLLKAHVAQGDNQHHGKEKIRDSAGVTHAEILERILVEVMHQHRGRTARAALGHQHDRIEHLEGADNAHDKDEENGRAEHGDSDIPELLELVGAV